MSSNSNKTIISSKEKILEDYLLAVQSREISLLGRKEVFMGKAKFGIFGDGKEIAQIVLSKMFKKGDWRSGYYRDQTLMLALKLLTPEQFFAQLYAHADIEFEPSSGGRMMNSHFGTRSLNSLGQWKNLTNQINSSSDISPTASQMPRLLGLAFASKLFRKNKALCDFRQFSNEGNEVAFGTIGNASTSEGHFFEVMNAAGILQVPLVLAVWDDGYGISVPNSIHTIKESISKIMEGFQRADNTNGIEILVARGWNYLEMSIVFEKATSLAREKHVPCLIHITELTQPQGHSTSGSHERYKSKERLRWESKFDCNLKMREWILAEKIADEATLYEIEKEAKTTAKNARNAASSNYFREIKSDQKQALALIGKIINESQHKIQLTNIYNDLEQNIFPLKSDVIKACTSIIRTLAIYEEVKTQHLKTSRAKQKEKYSRDYSSHLISESEDSALKINEVKPFYKKDAQWVDGRKILNLCFDHHLSNNSLLIALGEDVGKIGDVNQGFAGMQNKHGNLRVIDTGIRENAIIGKGIGAALRGLRPIVEIQYLDYLLYSMQILSDDLATTHHRTKGGQKAPLIIRTRGHRLEGMWHSGSPMGMILNAVRGIHIAVPRNMTQAVGFYNTLLASDDPAIIVETLNGYRLKEKIPNNLFEIKTPLGTPEILQKGKDLTVVTYGSMCRIVMEVAAELTELNIFVEIIDVQTLLPFDLTKTTVKSLQKTNAVLFLDEDVPGGATAYMMQQVLDRDGGYQWLDVSPKTLTAKNHRPTYGSDGDYFSKPNSEEVFEVIYGVMNEKYPEKYPKI